MFGKTGAGMARFDRVGGIEFAVAPGAAALAVAGAGGVSFVSGGRTLRLSLKAEGERGSLVLEDTSAHASTVLAEGSVVETSEAFSALSRRILASGRPRRRGKAAALLGTLALGFLLGTFLGGGPAPRDAASPQDALIRELLAKPGETPEPGTPRGALESLGKGTAVLPTPDFLAVPDELPPLPGEAPAARAPSSPAAAPAPVAPPAAPTPASPAPETSEAAPRPRDGAVRAPSAAEQAAAAAVGAAARPAPAPEAPASATPEAAPAPAAGGADAPTAEGAPVPAHDAKTKAEAEKVVGSMVKEGMTSEDAMKILANLQELAGEDGQITPEMLKTLPHEVAKVLLDSGAVTQDDVPTDANGTPHRIIRLSDEVMAAHVGKDGIPNIPHQNSWASTGNTVSLPLPGGGDVKAPSDLQAFGLQP